MMLISNMKNLLSIYMYMYICGVLSLVEQTNCTVPWKCLSYIIPNSVKLPNLTRPCSRD